MYHRYYCEECGCEVITAQQLDCCQRCGSVWTEESVQCDCCGDMFEVRRGQLISEDVKLCPDCLRNLMHKLGEFLEDLTTAEKIALDEIMEGNSFTEISEEVMT